MAKVGRAEDVVGLTGYMLQDLAAGNSAQKSLNIGGFFYNAKALADVKRGHEVLVVQAQSGYAYVVPTLTKIDPPWQQWDATHGTITLAQGQWTDLISLTINVAKAGRLHIFYQGNVRSFGSSASYSTLHEVLVDGVMKKQSNVILNLTSGTFNVYNLNLTLLWSQDITVGSHTILIHAQRSEPVSIQAALGNLLVFVI